MVYDKTLWINRQTKLNATNMNHIEEGIYQNSLSIESINQSIASITINLRDNYYSKLAIDEMLQNYYTRTAIDEFLNCFYTKNEIGAILSDYSTKTWIEAQGYSTFSGDYNDLINKPTIPVVPTNVSAFVNDAGYLTEHQSLTDYAKKSWVQQQGYLTSVSWNDVSGKPTDLVHTSDISDMATKTWVAKQGYSTFSGNYNDLTNKPTIPDAVEANPTVPSGTTPTPLSGLKIGNAYYSISGGSGGTVDWSNITNKPTDFVYTNDIADMATQTWVGQQGFLTSSDISDMATKTWVQNQGYLTQHQSLAGYATEQWVQNQGYISALPNNVAYKDSDNAFNTMQTINCANNDDNALTLVSGNNMLVGIKFYVNQNQYLNFVYSGADDRFLLVRPNVVKTMAYTDDVSVVKLAAGSFTTYTAKSIATLISEGYTHVRLTGYSQYADMAQVDVVVNLSTVSSSTVQIQKPIPGWNDPLNFYVFSDNGNLAWNGGSDHTIYVTLIEGIK